MKKTKKHFTIIEKFWGLEYITIENVPLKESSSHNDVLNIDLAIIEKKVATLIVENYHIPIRGKEVKFLRKVAGLSMSKFAVFLGLSAPAIKKWEDSPYKRIGRINEVAVRALVGELLGINTDKKPWFSYLYSETQKAEKIILKAS
ncbi:MAG: hypothetical protein HQK51_15635 [Oligoflexia bacterium]|nr:hypothetical protein [Oligoflexia bacterium]